MALDRRPVLALCSGLLAALIVAPPVWRRPPWVPGVAPAPDTVVARVRPEPLLGGGTILAGEPITVDVEAVVSRPGRFALLRGGVELAARRWGRPPRGPEWLRWTLSLPAAADPALELVATDQAPVAIDVPAAVAGWPRVLIVDAAPRWEWRAATRALTRDPGLEVRATLLEAEPDWVDLQVPIQQKEHVVFLAPRVFRGLAHE